ncbi:MAG TPA: cupin domain-containing protein [Rhodanobacteraceae bacterium]|nr:cupin domain-containing protein [Rhodanobacteraceae bacterium]
MPKAHRAAPPIEVDANAHHPLGMPPVRFLRDYWQKHPLLIRNAFPDFAPPLSPDDLAGLACMDGALARIVLQTTSSLRRTRRGAGNPLLEVDQKPDSGSRPRRIRNDDKSNWQATLPNVRWEVHTGPFEETTFARLPERNWTLLVQDVDKWDAGTAALLDRFAFIPSWRIDDVMISYAIDGGGVGAHVDQYDVFLLQGSGQRRWSIDTHANPSTEFRDDVELKLLREFRPTHQWTLDPGDMLYLPPNVPHDGEAVGDCMTFSIGMRAPSTAELLLDLAVHVAESLPESRRFADPGLQPADRFGEIDDDALQRARLALGVAAIMPDDDAFADWFGGFITRYRTAQVPVPRKRTIDRIKLAERLPNATLEVDPWSRFAWRRRGRDARLYVAGNVFDAPLAWARELASGARTLRGSRLAKLPKSTRGIALLAKLIDAGFITFRQH